MIRSLLKYSLGGRKTRDNILQKRNLFYQLHRQKTRKFKHLWTYGTRQKMMPNFRVFFFWMCVCGTAVLQIGRLLPKNLGS